jgi:hypothetical protein
MRPPVEACNAEDELKLKSELNGRPEYIICTPSEIYSSGVRVVTCNPAPCFFICLVVVRILSDLQQYNEDLCCCYGCL